MTPYSEQGSVTIYHGDAVEILPELGAIDLVVTDPPYTFGLASTSKETQAGGWGDLMNSARWYALWMEQCRGLLGNKNGAAWVFNSWRSFPVLARASSECRWPIESLMVWDKQWIGPGGQRGLRPSYELCALLVCRGFQIKDRGIPDIWPCPWSSKKPNGHPAEKPVDLLARIVRESGGWTVLDPFMGSGSVLVAAKQEGQSAIGIEIEERWCEVAAKRLQQEYFDFA